MQEKSEANICGKPQVTLNINTSYKSFSIAIPECQDELDDYKPTENKIDLEDEQRIEVTLPDNFDPKINVVNMDVQVANNVIQLVLCIRGTPNKSLQNPKTERHHTKENFISSSTDNQSLSEKAFHTKNPHLVHTHQLTRTLSAPSQYIRTIVPNYPLARSSEESPSPFSSPGTQNSPMMSQSPLASPSPHSKGPSPLPSSPLLSDERSQSSPQLSAAEIQVSSPTSQSNSAFLHSETRKNVRKWKDISRRLDCVIKQKFTVASDNHPWDWG